MPDLFPVTEPGAEFSPCRRYRYLLRRAWADRGNKVAFIGLNPSTADETQNDPTIRRCIGFAKAWGYNGLFMLNLFAWRATDPKTMKAATDPIGPENDEFIYRVACRSLQIVACWGAHGDFQDRAEAVAKIICGGPDQSIWCFGLNRDGSPKHPLYVPRAAKLIRWKSPE